VLVRSLASVFASAGVVVGLVIGTMAMTSGPASAAHPTTAAPRSSTTTAPPASTTTTTQPGNTISWSVEPATAKGATGKPAFIYRNVTPGTTLHTYVGITNYSNVPVTFAVYPADAVNTSTGGFDVVRQGQQSVGVGVWTKLARSTVTVPAGIEENIPVTIDVPTNATPGDHYGGIMAQISSSTGKNDRFRVNRRVGARVYLRIIGPIHPSLDIQNLGLDYGGNINPFAAGTATVHYTVTNNGNLALSGSQAVTITSLFGTLASGSPKSIVNLLPGKSQDVTLTLTGIPPAGPIDANVTLVPSIPKGTTDTTPTKKLPTLAAIEDSTGTWAVPWLQFILFVLLLVALWRWRRWRKRRGSKLERAVAAAREEGRREGEAGDGGKKVGGDVDADADGEELEEALIGASADGETADGQPLDTDAKTGSPD